MFLASPTVSPLTGTTGILRENSMNLTKDKISARMIRHTLKIIEEATDLNQLTLMIKLE